jgi:hypothetical protein
MKLPPKAQTEGHVSSSDPSLQSYLKLQSELMSTHSLDFLHLNPLAKFVHVLSGVGVVKIFDGSCSIGFITHPGVSEKSSIAFYRNVLLYFFLFL